MGKNCYDCPYSCVDNFGNVTCNWWNIVPKNMPCVQEIIEQENKE